jgi:hypothetical protein
MRGPARVRVGAMNEHDNDDDDDDDEGEELVRSGERE